MNTVHEYRVPLFIGAGTLVVILVVWVALISPQNTKLSNLQAQETQLQTQQTGLQTKLAALRTEQQRLSSSCADLQKISTQIPSVQSPTDIDAEESSFESQFNALTASSGVTLTQFSGFAPATSTSGTTASPATTTPSASGGTRVPVPRAQPVSRLCRPRWGSPGRTVRCWRSSMASTTSPDCSSSRRSSCPLGQPRRRADRPAARPEAPARARPPPRHQEPPLWTGGTPTAATAGPYSLAITGSIFYTSSPNALAACSRATADTKGG